MDRTFRGDLHEALGLVLGQAIGEAHDELEPGRAAAFGRRLLTVDLDQPLRSAYISSVIAVQEAREAASSSWGLGAVSSPPVSIGSSALTWWSRTRTSCWKACVRRRRAVALMIRG